MKVKFNSENRELLFASLFFLLLAVLMSLPFLLSINAESSPQKIKGAIEMSLAIDVPMLIPFGFAIRECFKIEK